MDEELIYSFVEDGSIKVETTNTCCEGIRLKIHSNVADDSLVLRQIKFKITWEKFISEKSGSISEKNAWVSLPEECSLIYHACFGNNCVYLFEKRSLSCPYQIFWWIQVEHVDVDLICLLDEPSNPSTPPCWKM